MNLARLQHHLFQFHSIVFGEEEEFMIDEWYEAEEIWNGSPPPPSSESEREDNTVEEVIEETIVPKLPTLPPRSKVSGSSSDSSSSSSSSSRRKMKKSHTKKISDKNDAKINEVEDRIMSEMSLWKREVISNMDAIDSRASDRSNKGNTLMGKKL